MSNDQITIEGLNIVNQQIIDPILETNPSLSKQHICRESTDLIPEQDNEEYNDNPVDHDIGHSYESLSIILLHIICFLSIS